MAEIPEKFTALTDEELNKLVEKAGLIEEVAAKLSAGVKPHVMDILNKWSNEKGAPILILHGIINFSAFEAALGMNVLCRAGEDKDAMLRVALRLYETWLREYLQLFEEEEKPLN